MLAVWLQTLLKRISVINKHYETNNIENGGDSNGIYKNKIPALYNHEHKNNYTLR